MTRIVGAAFKKRNPKDELAFHGTNVGYTFDAIMIAADAYRRAKTTDPKALAEAVRQTNIPVANRMSLGGPIRFNPKGQVEGNLSAAIQNLNGIPRVTLPDGVRRGEGRVSFARLQAGVGSAARTRRQTALMR